MLGKIKDLDPIDRIEIQNLLRDIEEALSVFSKLSLQDHVNLSSSENSYIFRAPESFKIIKKFLLG